MNIPLDLARIAEIGKRFKELEKAKEFENDLGSFLRAGWKYIDPAPYVHGWHMDAIAEHLMAVTTGHIRRLVINVPPRSSKSSLVSVAWPAWTWIQSEYGPLSGPHVQFLFSSYAQTLSIRDAVKSRRLIESHWYQKQWKDRFKLTSDQNTKIRFENDQGGYRLSTSVGGTLTGDGGSIICCDDPHNAVEMESELIRKNTLEWWDESLSTRLNDPATGAYVVIMQRLHEEDLTGHIMSRESENWTWLMLPMKHETERHCTTYIEGKEFWTDPRVLDGELLCEKRFGANEVADLERRLGPYAAASQLQQSPAPRGGGIIKREFWKLWDEEKFPPFQFLIASLDTAYTAKQENDASALTIWGVFHDEAGNPKIMLIFAWEEHLEFNDLVNRVIDTCTVDGRKKSANGEEIIHPRFPVDRVVIEAKASGHSLAQEMHRLFSQTGQFGIDMVGQGIGKWTPDKVARVHSIQHLFAEGLVYAPNRDYAEKVIEQCGVFPKGRRDDLVDSTSIAMRYLRDMGLLVRRSEYSVALEEEMMHRGRPMPLYPV